jgi:hypothetical protein
MVATQLSPLSRGPAAFRPRLTTGLAFSLPLSFVWRNELRFPSQFISSITVMFFLLVTFFYSLTFIRLYLLVCLEK